jgi:hypothetical protein
MSFLVDPGPTNQQPNYTGVQVQTSVSTLPIPVFWGTGKLAPNIIEYTDFQGKKESEGGKGGGKGGTENYSASVILAFAEGTVDGVPLVIVNANKLQTLSDLGMTLLTGTWPDQSPWAYLVQKHPQDAFPYPGTAALLRENYNLGSSAAVPNHNILAQRLTGFEASWCSPNTINADTYPKLATAFADGIPTADLALCILDMLTSAQYGVTEFPAASLNTATLLSGDNAMTTGDAALQTYLRALGLGFCPVLDSQETAQSILQRWLQIANCAAVWSGTALKFIPYGDEAITANGVTYVPNLAPIYSIGDDDYVGDSGNDPLQIARTDTADAYNVVRVEITTDDGWFAFLPVEARDQNAIELAGGDRIMPTVTAHEIVGATNGQLVAQLILQQGLYWRNTATFKLSWEFCLLEPMDFILLSDANLGLDAQMYRVLSIEEDDSGELTVTAQEYVPGVSTAGAGTAQDTSSNVPDSGQVASAVNPPVLFEPGSGLSVVPQIWVCACGGGGGYDPNWGGANVYLSTDDVNYSQVGSLNGACRMGVLTATLASYGGANPDNTNTLTVDLSESQGTLDSVTSSDAAAGQTLCYCDGELLGFTTATLVDATASGEAQTIPSLAPYQLGVVHEASFIADGGVVYASSGVALGAVSSNPAAGQYAVTEGLYVFNAADAGKGVLVTYTYANPFHYALTGLYRALYGTTAGAHASGAQFARLDSSVFAHDLPKTYIGVPVSIKFESFNVFGAGLQDLSGATVYTYTPSGTGYGGGARGVPTTPSGFTATAYTHAVGSAWNANPPADNVTGYGVLRAPGTYTGGPPGSAALLWSGDSTAYNDSSPLPSTTYTYWVWAANAAGQSMASSPQTIATGADFS